MALTINRNRHLPVADYFPEAQRKTGIAIHHTVGTTVGSAVQGWEQEKSAAGGAAPAPAAAYQAGYQVAYTRYRDLSQRYVAELRKPRISLGSTARMPFVGGVGVLIGRLTR